MVNLFHRFCLLLLAIAVGHVRLVETRQLLPLLHQETDCQDIKVSEQEVTNECFNKFGTWQRPRMSAKDSILIGAFFSLSGIDEVMENRRVLKLTGHLELAWHDQINAWNMTFPLNCVPFLVIPAKTIWTPDISLKNNPSTDASSWRTMSDSSMVRIHNDGLVEFSPGGTFEVYCAFDFTLFPFDTQNCRIQFESARYSRNLVNYVAGLNQESFQERQQHDTWTVTSVTTKIVSYTQDSSLISWKGSGYTFDRVECHIVIQRKSNLHIMFTVIMPVSAIAMVPMAAFTLPVDDSMKVDVLFMSFLVYSLLSLAFTTTIIPYSSAGQLGIPLLSLEIYLQLVYISFALLCQALVLGLVKRVDELPQPLMKAIKSLSKVSILIAKPIRRTEPLVIEPTNQQQSEPNNSCANGESENFASTPQDVVVIQPDGRGVPATDLMGSYECDCKFIDDDDCASEVSAQDQCLNGCAGAMRKTSNRTSRKSVTPLRTPSDRSQQLTSASSKQTSKAVTTQINRKSWYCVARGIDRFSFYCYLTFSLCTPLTLFLVAFFYVESQRN